MTPNALGLDTANKSQGLDVIPAGTLVELVMKIRAGTVGLENLCKRSSKGDGEGLDLEFTVQGGDYDGRKLFAFQLLNGTTAGHAKAAEITRAMLRAIFEAVNAHRSERQLAGDGHTPRQCDACRLQRRHLSRHAGGRARRQAPGRYRQLPRQEYDRESPARRRPGLPQARPTAADADRALRATCTAACRRAQRWWFARGRAGRDR